MIVKICGLRNAGDAEAAVAAGADLAGVVLASGPRRLDAGQAREVVRALQGRIPAVGVYVDEEAQVVARQAAQAGLSYVQLHGAESPDYCRSMPVPVIKAFRVGAGWSADRLLPYRGAIAYALLDALVLGQAGGTGRTFPWELAAGVRELGVPWLLAGGLNPDQVAVAIGVAHPDGVDVSSGVELPDGTKSAALMRRFVARAKGGDQ